MTYDMEDFLKSCITPYLDAVGPDVKLHNYSTPCLPEDHQESPSGAPGVGPVRECPWCYHTGPPASFVQYPSVDKLLVHKKAQAETSAGTSGSGGPSAKADVKPVPDEGKLASVACSLLMKVLWPRVLRARIYYERRITERPKC